SPNPAEPSPPRLQVVEVLHGGAEDPPHRSEEASSVVRVQVLDPPAGVDPRLPQDLVGHEVPDPGHEPLVHQEGLHASAPARERPQELTLFPGERVRPEAPQHALQLVVAPAQPPPAEPPHVSVAELALL